MKATGKTVIILPDWAKEEKYGSIVLPEKRTRDLPNAGLVLAVSPNAGAEFGIGHRVIYDTHKQQLMDHGGKRLTVVKTDDVLAILEAK